MLEQFKLMDKFPVFKHEVSKEDTTFTTVDEVLDFLNSKIEEHPVAGYIATFDHYAHTENAQGGEIAEGIRDAKNLIFCFGKLLPKPDVMSVRPRSFGVAELEDRFVLSFMEAPNDAATESMKQWAEAVQNK